MQLLLLEHVTGLGQKFAIVEVDSHFALNTLLPKRQALIATPGVRKRYADSIRAAASPSVE